MSSARLRPTPDNLNRTTYVHPTPYTLRPAPYTLHPTPYILHPTYTPHPTPYTPHLTPYTLHPTPCTLHPTPYAPPALFLIRSTMAADAGMVLRAVSVLPPPPAPPEPAVPRHVKRQVLPALGDTAPCEMTGVTSHGVVSPELFRLIERLR
jgi:hypothetical protein